VKFNNPIRGKLVLPVDCFDLTNFDWSDEPVTAAAPKPKRSFKDFEKSVATVVLPEPIQFKSLADTLNDLVSVVRGFKRPALSPFAAALSGK